MYMYMYMLKNWLVFYLRNHVITCPYMADITNLRPNLYYMYIHVGTECLQYQCKTKCLLCIFLKRNTCMNQKTYLKLIQNVHVHVDIYNYTLSMQIYYIVGKIITV